MKKKEKKELEKFFDYILDKVEDCYKKEVKIAINGFLKETALEVPVQEQLSDNTNELLLLLITANAVISKAIQIIKNNTIDQ